MKRLIFTIIFSSIILINTVAQTKDWAQYERYSKENSEIAKRPKAVFMGNSITDFWIKNDSAFFINNNFVDRGISGQTTLQMLARFRPDVINLHPESVVILAGINDIAQNCGTISLENILGNILSMVELAQHNNIRVVLCSILPCDEFKWAPHLSPAADVIKLNEMIRKYAKENGITYVDYHSILSTPTGGMPAEYSSDGCHPNLKCYKIMEEILLKGINNNKKQK